MMTFERSAVMGVLNATPDSFSDAGAYDTLDARVARARELVADGADVLDIGGQSGITGVDELDPDEEIRRVLPLVERVRHEYPDLPLSVDTYKPPVADAALAAGADIINDTSGLKYPELLDVVAAHEGALVVMHNLSRPKERLTDPDLYRDLISEVMEFLVERIERVRAAGLARDSIIVDPGPDFSKSPFHTVQVLRSVERFHDLGHPLLLAVSRKDFIGAITGTAPDDRLAGTLAAVGHVAGTRRILRVHDVREVCRFLQVHDVLRGATEIDVQLQLDPTLRRTRLSVDRASS